MNIYVKTGEENDTTNSNHLHTRFINGLNEYFHTEEDIKQWRSYNNKNILKFCNTNPNIINALNEQNHDIREFYEHNEQIKNQIKTEEDKYERIKMKDMLLKTKCICGQIIHNICIITDNTQCFIIGSCCIEYFIEKKCISCGNEYSRRIDSLCNACRKKNKNKNKKELKIIKPIERKEIHLDELIEQNRIYLNVPYSEKDEAKKLGAKWSQNKKQWYITKNNNKSSFKKWL